MAIEARWSRKRPGVTVEREITAEVCPKCKGDQPLYRKRVRKGETLPVGGIPMLFACEAVLFECVRCRRIYREGRRAPQGKAAQG